MKLPGAFFGARSLSGRRGEKIYEYDLDVTGGTDYGVSLDAILSGSTSSSARFPPP